MPASSRIWDFGPGEPSWKKEPPQLLLNGASLVEAILANRREAKRYIREKGSEKVLALLREADELGLSVICFPEIISALNRINNEKKITRVQYLRAKQQVANDLSDVFIYNITENTVVQVVHLLEENSLMTMDAFHIAAAQEWKCDVFASGDKRQIKAAKKSDLQVLKVS